MRRGQENSTGGMVLLFFVILNAIVLEQGLTSNSQWYELAYITVPLLLGSVFFFGIKPLRIFLHGAKIKKRKTMNSLSDRFSRLGSEHNLSFSAQEILKNHVIGLDGINRKLLILNTKKGEATPFVFFDVKQVKNTSVKMHYGTIRGGELNKKPLEQYLQTILLHLELEDSDEPVEVLFYDHQQDGLSSVRELEAKARQWETIIAKLRVPAEKRA
jgi:hypothetical protein